MFSSREQNINKGTRIGTLFCIFDQMENLTTYFSKIVLRDQFNGLLTPLLILCVFYGVGFCQRQKRKYHQQTRTTVFLQDQQPLAF